MSQSISLLLTCLFHKARATNSRQCLRPHIILLFLQSSSNPSSFSIHTILFAVSKNTVTYTLAVPSTWDFLQSDVHMSYSCASLNSLLRGLFCESDYNHPTENSNPAMPFLFAPIFLHCVEHHHISYIIFLLTYYLYL